MCEWGSERSVVLGDKTRWGEPCASASIALPAKYWFIHEIPACEAGGSIKPGVEAVALVITHIFAARKL